MNSSVWCLSGIAEICLFSRCFLSFPMDCHRIFNFVCMWLNMGATCDHKSKGNASVCQVMFWGRPSRSVWDDVLSKPELPSPKLFELLIQIKESAPSLLLELKLSGQAVFFRLDSQALVSHGHFSLRGGNGLRTTPLHPSYVQLPLRGSNPLSTLKKQGLIYNFAKNSPAFSNPCPVLLLVFKVLWYLPRKSPF